MIPTREQLLLVRWATPRDDRPFCGLEPRWGRQTVERVFQKMSTIKELVDRNKKRRKCKAKDDIKELIEALMTSNELMYMIQEWMQGQGLDTDEIPLMFYPEALSGLIFSKMKEAGVFEGIPATVKYVSEKRTSDKEGVNRILESMPEVWKRVELKNDDVHIGTDANVPQQPRTDHADLQRTA